MLSKSLLSFLLVSLSFSQIATAGLDDSAHVLSKKSKHHHHHDLAARSHSPVPTGGLDAGKDGFNQIGAYFTSKDMKHEFSWTENAIKFSKGVHGADFVVNSESLHQPIDGFGTAITDASGSLLQTLKSKDSSRYNDVMDYLFNPRTGMQMVRVPMGSSDFSMSEYCFKHKKSDNFDLGEAEKYIIPTMQDALKRNPKINFLLSPWSAPPYLKTSSLLSGGYFKEGGEDDLAEYFLDTVKAFEQRDIKIWGFTMQNEPYLESNWFSSMAMTAEQQGKVAGALRSKLDAAGFKDITLLAHDHNWANVQEGIQAYKSNKAFDGIGMHCYKGQIDALKTISQQAPKAEIHSTECSSTATKDYQSPWTQLYWWLNSRFFPAVSMKSRTFILWNTALDSEYGPHWSKVFCTNCKAAVTIDGAKVSLESQSYAISHYSAASASTATIGGGRSHAVQVHRGSSPTQSSTWLGCIDTQAFAAPLDGANIKKSSSKRMGLLLINKCDDPIKLRIADKVKNQITSYEAAPGVHTLVWH